MVVNLIIAKFVSLFNCMTVGRSSDSMTVPSDGQRLFINVCYRANCGFVCVCLVFWYQISVEPFGLFHHSSVLIIHVSL